MESQELIACDVIVLVSAVTVVMVVTIITKKPKPKRILDRSTGSPP